MSIKLDILSNITTELAKITVLNGYNQDIKYVEKNKLKAPDELNIDQFPAAFIIASTENKAHGDVEAVDCNFEVIISGYIKRNLDTDDMQLLSTNFANDIEKCLMVDESRGGYAIDTHCFKILTDHLIFDGYSVFDMYFDIHYFHDRKDPNSQFDAPH